MSKPLVHIYTDGACSPNPGIGGWAAVLISPQHDNYRKELSDAEEQSTNNRMELTAVIRGLESLKFPCEVKLHTDSKYIQQAFTKKWIETWKKNGWMTKNRKPVLNQDLWKALSFLTETHDVEWIWVKGHSSNEENNRCDELAVQARKELANRLKYK